MTRISIRRWMHRHTVVHFCNVVLIKEKKQTTDTWALSSTECAFGPFFSLVLFQSPEQLPLSGRISITKPHKVGEFPKHRKGVQKEQCPLQQQASPPSKRCLKLPSLALAVLRIITQPHIFWVSRVGDRVATTPLLCTLESLDKHTLVIYWHFLLWRVSLDKPHLLLL